MSNISATFLEFAWHNMTDQQQFRVRVKYEIATRLTSLEKGENKRSVYRAVADKYCYTMRTIEKIAVELKE